jgi:hypothetical protein
MVHSPFDDLTREGSSGRDGGMGSGLDVIPSRLVRLRKAGAGLLTFGKAPGNFGLVIRTARGRDRCDR